MWIPLVLIALIAVHAQAGFAPALLQWEGAHDRTLILAPESALHNALVPRKPSVLPEKLSIWDETVDLSHGDIPRFTANLDKTISSAEGFCLEAGEDASEDVRINYCTGRPNQLWSFLPSGNGGLNQIQLEAVNKCIGIDVHDGGLNGSPIHLRECAHRTTEAWKLEEPTPLWTQRPLQQFPLRRVMISVIALAGLSAVSVGALLWQRRRNVRSMSVNQDGRTLPCKFFKVDHGENKLTVSNRIALSTKVSKPMPGGMINNHQKVHAMAEDAVAQYSENMEAEKKAKDKLVLDVLTGSDVGFHASRRHTLQALTLASVGILPQLATAEVDCMQNCTSNCNRVAPRNVRFCESNCEEYCAQNDRRDGLSGSVSSDAAEIGLASAYDLTRFIPGSGPKLVPYGDDRPPGLPDVFGVKSQLRRAITGGAKPDGKSRWSVEGQGGVK